MRKFLVGVLSGGLVSIGLAAPASANTCNPKYQGVCDAVHDIRCTADQIVSIIDENSRLCTF